EKALHDADNSCGPAAERTTTASAYWSRWAYLAFHVRQNLALVLMPFVLLIVMKDLPRLFPQPDGDYQFIATVLAIGAALFVLAFTPWVMRLILGLRPMPAGPLRDRLRSAGQRLN